MGNLAHAKFSFQTPELRLRRRTQLISFQVLKDPMFLCAFDTATLVRVCMRCAVKWWPNLEP